MSRITRILLAAMALSTLSLGAMAESTGVERAVGGAADAVTSPGNVVEGVEEETRKHGPVGVVTGSVKGGAKAAGQVVKGAADIGVGVVETLTKPLTGDD